MKKIYLRFDGIKKHISAFLLICVMTVAAAQTKTVSGVITDPEEGIGLPGVTIQIKGTQSGTVTDIDGRYTLSVSEDDILIISYIGYATQEIPVGQRSVIDIDLTTDAQELSEVVVIGYGKVEKGDVTGVVNKVDAKEFNKGMLTSPEQLLAGKVAGVQITQNSGEPGGQISIRMRGGTSLTASNEPLFVVDGIPLENTVHDPGGLEKGRNPLNFINPADIADITVLKDASASAIYGSRGANGVIIITTKSGVSGKPQFTYDGSFSVSSIVDEVRMLNREEFVFAVGRKGPRNLDELGESNTDWFDEILQLAQGHNHSLGATFGGKNNSARVSFNYQNLDGIVKTSNTERIAGSLNFTQRFLNDDLTANISVKTSLTNDRFTPAVIGSALIFDPTQSIFSTDPTTGFFFEWDSDLAAKNPVSEIEQTFAIGKTKRALVGANINYNLPFLEGLSVKVNYAYDVTRGDRQRTQLATLQTAILTEGSFVYEQFNRDSNLLEAYLSYSKDVSAIDGRMEVTGGYSYQDFFREFPRYEKLDSIPLSRYNINDPLSIIEESQLNELESIFFRPNYDEFENRLISFWGRVNFDIKDKYLITATLRRDGSTRFAESNRWGMFPSVALGWRIIDEPFAASFSNVFSDLKMRVSYGVTGSQEIGDYLYVNLYDEGGERAQYLIGSDTVNTLRPNSIDPEIKWEETSSLNVGLDFGFLGGRLNGSIDVYRKLTSDLLFDIAFPIGTLTGDRAVTNIGEVENKGIELLLNSVVVDRSDLKVNLSFNASYNRNEILKLDNSNLPSFQGYETGGIEGDVGQTIQVLKVGQPVNSFFVYQHIIGADGNPVPDGEDANGDGIENDLDMYVDQITVDTNDDGIPDARDGIINEDDKIPYKNPAPDVIMGLTSNIQYKKFDISLTLRSQLGGYVYNNVHSNYGSFDGVNGTFGPNNIHISAFENDFTEKQLNSDIYVEDASFLKLDNITVGYTFEEFKGIRARTYTTVTNLITITGYSGLDPEAGVSGIDNNLFPRSRNFLVGLNLTF